MGVSIRIVGHLGADAQLINGQNGQFLSFRVASNDRVNGKDVTSWFNVRLFGERATKLAEWLKTGRFVLVEGSESVGTYTAKDGSVQVSRDITAFNIEFINSGQRDNATEEKPNTGTFVQPSTAPATPPQSNGNAASVTQIPTMATAAAASAEDDLPF